MDTPGGLAPAGWRRWLLAFGVALAVLAGPAFPIYRHYDFSHSRDTLTYLKLTRDTLFTSFGPVVVVQLGLPVNSPNPVP